MVTVPLSRDGWLNGIDIMVDFGSAGQLASWYACDTKIPIHVRHLPCLGLHSNMKLNSILQTV